MYASIVSVVIVPVIFVLVKATGIKENCGKLRVEVLLVIRGFLHNAEGSLVNVWLGRPNAFGLLFGFLLLGHDLYNRTDREERKPLCFPQAFKLTHYPFSKRFDTSDFLLYTRCFVGGFLPRQ